VEKQPKRLYTVSSCLAITLENMGEAEENIDEEKEKSLKTGYITLYTGFF
jgi:hypothetical protein